jgi:hypothetical protein
LTAKSTFVPISRVQHIIIAKTRANFLVFISGSERDQLI